MNKFCFGAIYNGRLWEKELRVSALIYDLDTIYNPKIMTLAQAVLEIFCLTSVHWFIMGKTEKVIIQSWIWRILPKVNQVIYILDIICDQNIMTLAQAVLEIFCSQASIGLQCNIIEKTSKMAITLQ